MRLQLSSRVKCLAKDYTDARNRSVYGKVGDVVGFSRGKVWVDFGTGCHILIAVEDLRDVTKRMKPNVEEPIGLQIARGKSRKKRWRKMS